MSRPVKSANVGAARGLATLLAALALTTVAASAPTAPGDGFAADTTVRDALRKALGDGPWALAIEYRPVVLDSATRARITASTRSPFIDDTLRVFACLRGGEPAGYGVLDNVKGKSREITYLVAFTPAGAVVDVAILVYRESHGGEVSNPAFRDQFKGKKPGDPMVAGRDIRTISGATISSRSLTAGVAKILAAFQKVKEGL